LPDKEGVAIAAFIIAVFICAAVAPGFIDLYSAAAPDTCGVAMEVPL
jgi:hypothetical protein